MLIRWATEKDLPAWYELATEVSEIFQHPGRRGKQDAEHPTIPADMGAELRSKASGKSSVSRYEMLTAVDYMSGENMGFICFSRTDNNITWLAVSERYRGKGAGNRLLKTALRQLDTNRNITVTTFPTNNPQGTAARALYEKYGFTVEKPTEHNGLPRSEMKRPADREKRGKSFHHRYPEFMKAA